MTEGGEAAPEPPEDEGNRNVENAVMLGFFVVLVAAGIWLLGTMADVRKVQDCAAQGRRNCATIEVPTGAIDDDVRNGRSKMRKIILVDGAAGPDRRPGRDARRAGSSSGAEESGTSRRSRGAGRPPPAARRRRAHREKSERSERSAEQGKRRCSTARSRASAAAARRRGWFGQNLLNSFKRILAYHIVARMLFLSRSFAERAAG